MNKILKIIGWLLFIGVTVLLLILAIKPASASIPYDNYALKWDLCGAKNLSGMACDIWFSSFADLPTNSSISANMSGYYSKTEVDAKFQNLTGNVSYGNYSTSGFVTRAEFDNQTTALRNSIMDNYITNITFYSELSKLGYGGYNTDKSNFNPLWIVGGLAICVVIYVVYQATRKGNRRMNNPAVAIPSASSDSQRIGILQAELEKLKNKGENAPKKEFKKLPEEN